MGSSLYKYLLSDFSGPEQKTVTSFLCRDISGGLKKSVETKDLIDVSGIKKEGGGLKG